MHQTVAVMTQYYVISVGMESMESFSGNPIVVHRELNNHHFLRLPPLVCVCVFKPMHC